MEPTGAAGEQRPCELPQSLLWSAWPSSPVSELKPGCERQTPPCLLRTRDSSPQPHAIARMSQAAAPETPRGQQVRGKGLNISTQERTREGPLRTR